jgi:hypothetical protein
MLPIVETLTLTFVYSVVAVGRCSQSLGYVRGRTDTYFDLGALRAGRSSITELARPGN